MIINIRGTSGSGKTTLVTNALRFYTKEPVFVPKRKRPIRYRCRASDGSTLALIGHYETACGGCDTLPGNDEVFNQVILGASECDHVLFEGLLISADVNRTLMLHMERDDLRILHLNTSLQECLASVNLRRQARNPDLPPVNPHNTESKYRGVLSSVKRLNDAGAHVFSLDRQQAETKLREFLFPSLA